MKDNLEASRHSTTPAPKGESIPEFLQRLEHELDVRPAMSEAQKSPIRAEQTNLPESPTNSPERHLNNPPQICPPDSSSPSALPPHSDPSTDTQYVVSSDLPSMVSALPEELRAMARKSGCDPSLMTMLMFAAASSAAGKGYSWRSEDEVGAILPNLYTLISTPPAGGKTLGLQTVFGPIYEIESEDITKQKQEWKRKAEERKQRTWQKNDLEKLAANASGEARRRLAHQHVEQEERIVELNRQMLWTGNQIISDCTTAAIKNELWACPDQHLSLVLGDGREFLALLCRDGTFGETKGMRQVLLHGFGGDRISIYRGGSSARKIVLDDPRLTVLILAQTDACARFLAKPDNIDSGLVSRMLTFFFKRVVSDPKPVPTEAMARWTETVRSIFSHRGDAGSPIAFDADEQARRLLKEITTSYREIARNSETDPRASAFWSRAPLHLRKLALVRALMEPANLEVCVITAEMVGAADTILRHSARHMEEGWKLASEYRSESKEVARLRKAIESSPELFLRLSLLPAHQLSRAAVEEICNSMPDEFEIVNIPSDRPGRPAKGVRFRQAPDAA